LPRTKLFKFLQQKNIATVLRVLHEEKITSRAKISGLTGIAPSTVSSIVDQLAQENIVEYLNEMAAPSTGGRPPLLIRLNPVTLCAVGIEINSPSTKIMIVGMDGGVIEKHDFKIDATKNPERIVAVIAEKTEKVINRSSVNLRQVIGAGVSFRGLIDRDAGMVLRSTALPEWNHIPIIELLRGKYEIPFSLVNVANAMVVGEARFGIGQGKKTIVGVIVGDGIGGGIIINGQLHQGRHFTAGELGHTIVAPSGPVCHCGNSGCLCTVATESAVEFDAIRIERSGESTHQDRSDGIGSTGRTAKEIVADAIRGDAISRNIIVAAARYMGIAMVNVVQLIAPEIIIFNNGTLPSYTPYLDQVKRSLNEGVFAKELGVPEVVVSALGDNAVCVGAASVAMDRILADNNSAARKTKKLGS
jgi:predicted NBD/HSP70 family sugar kinase